MSKIHNWFAWLCSNDGLYKLCMFLLGITIVFIFVGILVISTASTKNPNEHHQVKQQEVWIVPIPMPIGF